MRCFVVSGDTEGTTTREVQVAQQFVKKTLLENFVTWLKKAVADLTLLLPTLTVTFE